MKTERNVSTWTQSVLRRLVRGDARNGAPLDEAPTWRDRIISAAALVLAAVAAVVAAWASLAEPSVASGNVVPSWRAWRINGEHPAEVANRDLAPLRSSLPPGMYIGYLVAHDARTFMSREPDVRRYFSSQYALAPAVLKLVYLPECAARGTWACGLERVRVILATDEVVPRARELGFEPVASAGGTMLLVRSGP